jgi:hypothetical protein
MSHHLDPSTSSGHRLLIVRPAEPAEEFGDPPAIGATAAYVLIDLGTEATLARCQLRYLGQGRARVTALTEGTEPDHATRLLRGVTDALQATGVRLLPDLPSDYDQGELP